MYRMVRRQHFDIRLHTCAEANAVYALLRDGASWPRWTSIESFQSERPGERESEGIGAIVRDYRGDVDLDPAEQGTTIRWHISFTPQVPGTGWLWRWGIGRFVKQSAQGLAAYAQATTSA